MSVDLVLDITRNTEKHNFNCIQWLNLMGVFIFVLFFSINFLTSLTISEIHSDLEKIEKPKMFILISTVMTWAKSKPLDPVSTDVLNQLSYNFFTVKFY